MTLGTFLLIFIFSLLGILLIYYIVFPVYKKNKAMQSRKNTSKEPINFIDRSFFYSSSNPTETDKPNFTSSSSDFFKVWNRDLHNSSDQKRRIKRAIYMDSTCYVNETDISASIQSSRDVFKFYQVCYDKCDCPDFSDRLKPCKHIYRLAFAMGALALSADKTKIYIRNKQSEYEFFMNNEEAEKTRTYVKTIDFPSKKHSNHSPQYYDFEYKYYDKILKKLTKLNQY